MAFDNIERERDKKTVKSETFAYDVYCYSMKMQNFAVNIYVIKFVYNIKIFHLHCVAKRTEMFPIKS